MSESRAAARAIDALRRGWAVRVRGGDAQALLILPVEGVGTVDLATFDPAGVAPLLLSGARAATLKLVNQRDAADPEHGVLVERPVPLNASAEASLALAMATADPVRDLMTPLKGPYHALPLAHPDLAAAALRLARHAGLLPAFFVGADDGVDATEVSVEAVDAYEDSGRLVIAARALLPVEVDTRAEIVAFRSVEDPREHVALILGTPDETPPVVRLHSECLTGDVLGSLKCDCGPQLHAALHEIAGSRWGVLLYLRQEGRGIGLINKLRAYQLQDQGFDTVDANVRLGFPIDARDFSVASRMLSLLGIPAVRLLTNNPAKVARLAAEGIEVIERVPHAVDANPHNERYLATKRDRTGHQL
ncbi:GTP cyclohydrolase II [Sphingobium sufflavum]|uniref:GTP cyclohydrolase II n=1 Tax=Sphingobium sufflavum TaxID=1129547 RepID=UPI001F000DA1|nr:GTP cyclohydrolase II [Sphingobium sufflavum]MCE7795527.1 GTP cyclohydrolase II [Sphingobium sufflavum]